MNELRGAARIAEAAFKAALPPPFVINGLTATHTTSGVNVLMGECRTTLNDNQAVCLRNWLFAAYPLDTAPDAGWVSVEERLPEPGRSVVTGFDGRFSLLGYVTSDKRWINPSTGLEVKPTHWRELPAPPAAKGGSSE